MRARWTNLLFLVLLAPLYSAAAEPTAAWPLPAGAPWSLVVMSPHDLIKNPITSASEPLGDILLGGEEGEPVVAIEAGVLSFAAYAYRPTWRSLFSNDNLADLTRDVQAISGADLAALHITLSITSPKGVVYYGGLAPDQPLPKTGAKVSAGQVLGRLGRAYPHLPPNLALQGSQTAGTNRILSVLKSPFPPLPDRKPLSRYDLVTQGGLLNDLTVFWRALNEYYPGLYDQTPRTELEASLSRFRNGIPKQGLSVGEFAQRLRTFQGLFSENHLSIVEPSSSDLFLPIEIGAIADRLFVVASPVKALPVGAEIKTLDGVSAPQVIASLWTQGGRSDGTLGNWEKETLSRNVASLWTRTSAHRAGDKIKVVLVDGSTSVLTLGLVPPKGQVTWWARAERVTKSRGKPVSGFDDTPNLVLRRLSDDTDVLTIASFDWSDLEKAAVDHYFGGRFGPLPGHLVLDLRLNPGGEEPTEWDFVGYFNDQELHPYLYKTVLQRKLSSAAGAGNLVDGDQSTFGRYQAEAGTYRAYSDPAETIPVRNNDRFRGRLIVLTSGMTGSAAFDAARLLQAGAGAILVGRPGPHGTNRMVAEKFAQVRLPATGVYAQIPLVKIVTSPAGETGPPQPLVMDVPVDISLDAITGKTDPEWDQAMALVANP